MTEGEHEPGEFPILTATQFAAALRAASAGTVLPSLRASAALRDALRDVADSFDDDADLRVAVRDARALYREEIDHHAPHLAGQGQAEVHHPDFHGYGR